MIATLMIMPTADYRIHEVMCTYCESRWLETTHELWNVVALTCPECGQMSAVRDTGDAKTDFHGDANSRDAHIENPEIVSSI